MAADELTDILTEEELLCPVCGYDLRGQRQTRCPECGHTYTIKELLREREARISHRTAKPWMTAIILIVIVSSIFDFARIAPTPREVWEVASTAATWLLAGWWVWLTRADWLRKQYASSVLVILLPCLYLHGREDLPTSCVTINNWVAMAAGVAVTAYYLARKRQGALFTLIYLAAYLVMGFNAMFATLATLGLLGIFQGGGSYILFGSEFPADTFGHIRMLCMAAFLTATSMLVIIFARKLDPAYRQERDAPAP